MRRVLLAICLAVALALLVGCAPSLEAASFTGASPTPAPSHLVYFDGHTEKHALLKRKTPSAATDGVLFT